MKTISILLFCLIIAGCAASIASKYGVNTTTDKFNGNNITVSMTGGAIDADYLNIVSSPAEINPVVIKTNKNEILSTYLSFNTESTYSDWLNITNGSTMILLLNDATEKIILKADTGDTDYSVSSIGYDISTTKYDWGSFPISTYNLKRIALANNIEIRVSGLNSRVDYPRINKHIIENLIPNIKKFYISEVKPYLILPKEYN